MVRLFDITINEPGAVQHYLLCEINFDSESDQPEILRAIAGRIDDGPTWRPATADELPMLLEKAQSEKTLLDQVCDRTVDQYRPLLDQAWRSNPLVQKCGLVTA